MFLGPDRRQGALCFFYFFGNFMSPREVDHIG
jgi:hypothetical protein